jgi:predicted GIY-YIG superfamily endonuclease
MVKLYCITNRINGKMYVGITTMTLRSRWGFHRREAVAGRGWKLGRAIRKYGATAFDMIGLYDYPSSEDACRAELAMIAVLDLQSQGYNVAAGAI